MQQLLNDFVFDMPGSAASFAWVLNTLSPTAGMGTTSPTPQGSSWALFLFRGPPGEFPKLKAGSEAVLWVW